MRIPSIAAPAKINLFLDLVARRSDGYHDLCTLFAEVSFADRLTLLPADRFVLSVDGPYAAGVPTDGGNLIWRALERLYAALPPGTLRHGVVLSKNVPHGAGLGGGSSDAAAALVLANSAAGDGALSTEALEAIAGEIGSDCPYFIRTGPALGTGRGTDLWPVALARPLPCLLVLPDFPISTREAYGLITPQHLGARSDVEGWKRWLGSPDGPPPEGANTFEAALFPRYPELREILTALSRNGASRARLSGSGSACFGLFESPSERDAAAASLAARWRCQPCEVLPKVVPAPLDVGRVAR